MFKFLITILAITSLASCAVVNPFQFQRRDQSQSAFFSSFFNANGQSNNGGAGGNASPATSSVNLASFYQNFMDNRYSYVHHYMEFFQTHSFSNVGTLTSDLSAFLTYTDNSYTTFGQHNPQVTSMLSSIATQFPWYSSWVQNKGVATATGSASATHSPSGNQKNAAVSVHGPFTQGKMGLLTAQILAVMTVGLFLFFY